MERNVDAWVLRRLSNNEPVPTNIQARYYTKLASILQMGHGNEMMTDGDRQILQLLGNRGFHSLEDALFRMSQSETDIDGLISNGLDRELVQRLVANFHSEDID